MTHLADNFASLSLKDVAGNRFALLNKIQEQVCSAISALHSGKDLLSIKKNVQYILEQVNKNLDLIKASCKEEGTNRHLAGNGFRLYDSRRPMSDVCCHITIIRRLILYVML